MRLKQFLCHYKLSAKTSLVWSRITFSRLTTAYFLFAVLHCVIQVIIQAQALSINSAARHSLWSLLVRANETQEANGFAVLVNDLRLCHDVPNTINTDSCQVIWGGNNQANPPHPMEAVSMAAVTPTSTMNAQQSTPSTTPSSVAFALPSSNVISPTSTFLALTRIALPTPTFKPLVPTFTAAPVSTVTVILNVDPPLGNTINNKNDGPYDGERIHNRRFIRAERDLEVRSRNGATLDVNDTLSTRSQQFADIMDLQLSKTCIRTLIWPVQTLSNTKREDITLIGFQVWVLGMSIVALLNESIPHVCAALVTHLLATIWTIFQVFQTETFRQNFGKFVTHGACSPNNLLGDFWEQRKDAEILSAVLNGAALLVSSFFTYKLMKIYGWQTFKRVGASLTINRVYKLVLSLSIAIQLALFSIVSAAALWIDQLYNGIGRLASLGQLYKGGIIVMFCLLIPWLSLGWFAVRRENRKLAMAFLVLSLFFIGLWAALFRSTSFRWTFVVWNFFAFMTVAAGALMIITFMLGVACRFNFGKGLPRYLNAEEPLEDKDFLPVYSEKWRLDDDPEKVEFPSSNGRPVPTFSATFGKGLEITKPFPMHVGPSHDPRTVIRSNSGASHHHHGSDTSTSSDFVKAHVGRAEGDDEGSHNQTVTHTKRWVIE